MGIFKKKDILEYKTQKHSKLEAHEDKVRGIEEEAEELEEFVNGMGATISGDKPNANDSEIEVSPGATTDSNMTKRIQPNRYLFNVDGQAARGGVDGTVGLPESEYKLARDKFISLLEDAFGPQISYDKTATDYNDNGVNDINELPDNVARKLTDLIDSVDSNNLNDEQIQVIVNVINSNLNA
jgi:hypothetical protein